LVAIGTVTRRAQLAQALVLYANPDDTLAEAVAAMIAGRSRR
jgi:hypothetical protein